MLSGWRDIDETLRTLTLLHRRIDGVFGGWEDQPDRSLRGAGVPWPSVNAFETKESFVYTAEVPGLGESDVSVHVEDEVLVLRGERKTEVPQGYEVRLRERSPIAFTRKLPLPGRVDAEGVSATMKNGILTVTLPKAKEARPRQITVKAV